jgi:hypothetical protein
MIVKKTLHLRFIESYCCLSVPQLGTFTFVHNNLSYCSFFVRQDEVRLVRNKKLILNLLKEHGYVGFASCQLQNVSQACKTGILEAGKYFWPTRVLFFQRNYYWATDSRSQFLKAIGEKLGQPG